MRQPSSGVEQMVCLEPSLYQPSPFRGIPIVGQREMTDRAFANSIMVTETTFERSEGSVEDRTPVGHQKGTAVSRMIGQSIVAFISFEGGSENTEGVARRKFNHQSIGKSRFDQHPRFLNKWPSGAHAIIGANLA